MAADGTMAVEFLLGRGRLERIDGAAAAGSARAVIDRAQRRLRTAAAAREIGDVEGAYAAAYDAYRIASEALLVCQGLRSTGGDGSHVAVEDAVSAQSAERIRGFAKPTFERLRRTRHSAQYFDPAAGEISDDDLPWALATAESVVAAVALVVEHDPPELFR